MELFIMRITPSLYVRCVSHLCNHIGSTQTLAEQVEYSIDIEKEIAAALSSNDLAWREKPRSLTSHNLACTRSLVRARWYAVETEDNKKRPLDHFRLR